MFPEKTLLLTGIMYTCPSGSRRGPGFPANVQAYFVDAAQQSLRCGGGTLVLMTMWEQKCRDCVRLQGSVWSQSGVCDLEGNGRQWQLRLM